MIPRWKIATKKYIKNYQRQRMRHINSAPPSIRLAAGKGLLDVRERRYNFGKLGYYDKDDTP